MRKWTISTNSYYNFGHYLLREAPWYVYAAMWFNFSILYRLVKLLTFNSRLTLLYFYKVAVPIYRKLRKHEKTTWVNKSWEDLITEHPELMKQAVGQSIKYSTQRAENPSFDYDDFHKKKLEYSSR